MWVLNNVLHHTLNQKTPDGKPKKIDEILKYDALKSITSKKTDQQAAVRFGSGDVRGVFYTDHIYLGTNCD